MRPRSQVAFISDEASVPEMLAEAKRLRQEFIPLFNRESDSIVGFLNAYRLLLDPEIDLTEVMEIPASVPETMNLLQLLQSLQRQHRGIAVRVSQHPTVVGLCQAYGGALVSTSANLSGQPAVSDYDALDPALLTRVDAIVPGQTGGLARPTAIRDALTGQALRE